jgi:phenylalanyl-tRNA synthetase alpha chain
MFHVGRSVSFRLIERYRSMLFASRQHSCHLQKTTNTFNIEYDTHQQRLIYPNELILNDRSYPTDKWTNVNPHILSRLNMNLHRQQQHPLNHLSRRLRQYFHGFYAPGHLSPIFSIIDDLSPIVTVEQNFDSICTPIDHVSRTKSMNYYAFLCIGDVYRRDSIDPTHYPVFHQCEGVRLFDKEELFMSNRNVLGDKTNLEIFASNGRK